MHLKNGIKMQRTGWNGKGMYLFLYSPAKEHPSFADEFATSNGGNFPLKPFIMMKTPDDMFRPYSPTQIDLLSEDWQTAV